MGLKVHFEKRFEDIKYKPFDSFENCKYVNIKNTDVILESDDLFSICASTTWCRK